MTRPGPIPPPIRIEASAGRPAQYHVFEQDSLHAIDAAFAARRPLLVYGEPGIGKSQLALAAAIRHGLGFVQTVVDAHTEPRELLWHQDAVARLAEAQLQGALQNREEADLREDLRLIRYIRPGPLWWAFNWGDASKHLKQGLAVECAEPPRLDDRCDSDKGCVLLIDEVDKAESDVPNGLLEALGASRFPVPGRADPVKASGKPLLVVITSNGERALPQAFVRRCLVLHLGLPDVAARPDQFERRLVERGRAHFEAELAALADHGDDLLRSAAKQVAADRLTAQQKEWRPFPGQAEYLDLLRAIIEVCDGKLEHWSTWLDQLGDFVLKKHPDAAATAMANRDRVRDER